MCFVLFVQEIVHRPGVWAILFRRHPAVHGKCHMSTNGFWSRFVQLVEVQGAAEESTAIFGSKDEVDVIGRLRSSGKMPSHWLAELNKKPEHNYQSIIIQVDYTFSK